MSCAIIVHNKRILFELFLRYELHGMSATGSLAHASILSKRLACIFGRAVHSMN